MPLVDFGLLVVVLAIAFQVEAELTDSITLSEVTRTKEVGSSGVSRSWSRGLQPAGTASDGSQTTFSEKVVEYEMTMSEGATLTFSTTSWEDLRIQSASGYVRIQKGSTDSSVESCSSVSGGGSCMNSINGLSQVQSSSGQSTATRGLVVTSTTSLLPVQTPTVVNSAAVPSTVTPSATAISLLASTSKNSDILRPALIGSLLGGLGVVLLVVGLFFVCRRQRRKTKGRKQGFCRELVGGRSINDISHRQHHYRSFRNPSSMAESSRDGISIDSSYFPYTKSPPHSPTQSFSAPVLSFKPHGQASPSPLSVAAPFSAEPQLGVGSLVPAESTRDTLTSQATVVASTLVSRQNTSDSITSSDSYTHPGHGFRIHPSRFIEELSLSESYMESLMAGRNSKMIYQEPNEMEPESPTHSHEDHDHEKGRVQSSSTLSEDTTRTHPDHDHDHERSPPPSPSPLSTTPRDSPNFATRSRTPNLGLFSHPSLLPITSRSVPHLPHAHSSSMPTTPTSPPHSVPRSWVTPSPFSHQTFETAEDGRSRRDSDMSTVNLPTRTISRSRPRPRSWSATAFTTDHGGMWYGYAV
ncbi:hypothetical protein E1B28_012746 [Marasmius oreades]|uniref:Uncharacterized protein n=1 Tax=Marasmius oreades TaxID=181124 RepID=A0A9P7RSX7_9AGAR|nr:uncharacterized protein E1B28_012746 [Marasmius oreades]KAG7088780.1 hypothetical protein E1B28_012746 [Marasmius oreades]